jgi:hypothetical protein
MPNRSNIFKNIETTEKKRQGSMKEQSRLSALEE